MGDLIIEKTISGDTVTFQSRIAAPIKLLKVDIMPIQPKTGIPSKDNKQPIYGWTGVDTVVCGENLFGNYNRDLFVTDGINVSVTNGRFIMNGICSLAPGSAPKSKITGLISGLDASKLYYWYGIPVDMDHLFYKEDTAIQYYNINGVPISPTASKNRIRFIWTCSPEQYFDLDFTAILTDTPPIRVTFPDEIGTVYGGTFDLISGELIVDTIKIAVDGAADWTMLSPGIYSLLGSIDNACVNTKLNKYRSNMYPFRGTGETKSSGLDKDGYFYIQSSVDRIWVYDSNYSTLADFKTFLNENPLELTYPTTATTTYQLPATEVKTLLTTNIITSDAGAVTVTYDDKDYTDLIAARRRILMETPHSESVSGGVASFNTNMAAKLKNLTVNIEPVQAGSGDPSPDNVRTITGWTGCNITKCGKNVLNIDSDWHAGTAHRYMDTGLAFLCKFSFTPKTQPVPDLTGISLGVSLYEPINPAATNKGYNWVLRNGEITASPTNAITYPSAAIGTIGRYLFINSTSAEALQRLLDAYDIQMEYGDIATPYEPYVATTIPIDWTDSAGTVYGDTLDVTTGVLTVDRRLTHLDSSLAWTVESQSGAGIRWRAFAKPTNPIPVQSYALISDKLAPATNVNYPAVYTVSRNGSGYFIIGIPDTIQTAAAWKEWLDSVGGIDVVEPLATPQTYQLTPTQVKTLLGNNTIYADTGDIELTYWKH